ncbi:MAG TPA: hypothetical protein VF792_06440 [Ktedonobacterales bacterium]
MRYRGRFTYWVVVLALALQLAACAPAASTSHHTPARPTATARATTTGALPSVGAITRMLRLADAPAVCPFDAAWASSGGQIAVLAIRGDTCAARPTTKLPDLIIIYDAHSGAIVRQISLAATLAQVRADIVIHPKDGFSGLRWSPDGSKLAVAIEPYAPATTGVLIVSVQNSTVRALIGPSHYGPDPTGQSRFSAATVWNVQSGAPAATIAIPLPAAERYQWSVDGNITPVSASVAPSPSIPAGNAQFSYWQPGFVAAVPTASEAAGYPAWLYSAATFTRWSPDSQYVATDLMTMNLAGATTGAPTTIQPLLCRAEFWPQPCNDLPIPPPDAAFKTVEAKMEALAESSHFYPNDAPVAWSPDGALLATVLPGDDGSRFDRVMTITLISTTTGAAIGTAAVTFKSSPGNIGMTRWPYFSWAPTSKQLAVVNSVDNEVEVVSITR